jgi:lincosamide nucleotidyltransferase
LPGDAEHGRFTERLRERLAQEPSVLGLVLLGSTSGEGAPADPWSDHDFFVVVEPGAQERFRSDLGWLPDAASIALSFRETAHGLKVVYESGHLAEFAVFEPDELRLARVNRYRVALDRADIAERMERVRAATVGAARADRAWEAGQFLTNLLVGVGRWRRGEHRSGDLLVRCGAMGHLLRLVADRVPPDDRTAPDDLDPFRRFERGWPRIAREVEQALDLPTPEAADRLLAIAEVVLGRGPELPAAAVEATRRVIRRKT